MVEMRNPQLSLPLPLYIWSEHGPRVDVNSMCHALSLCEYRLVRLLVDVSSVYKHVFTVCHVARWLGKRAMSAPYIITFSLLIINGMRVSPHMLPVTFPLLIAT